MKDLEWLKEEVDYIKSLVSMIGRGNTVAQAITAIKNIEKEIDQLDTPELPVIPDYVAEYIDYLKEREVQYGKLPRWHDTNHLKELSIDLTKCQNWRNENYDDFARAWLSGYTIEEKKYYVLDNLERVMLKKYSDGVTEINVGTMTVDSEWFESEYYELTEQEIKDYDPRYWAFAVPVEELEG